MPPAVDSSQSKHQVPLITVFAEASQLENMAKVEISDLSGASTPVGGNPYDRLINACNGNSVRPAANSI